MKRSISVAEPMETWGTSPRNPRQLWMLARILSSDISQRMLRTGYGSPILLASVRRRGLLCKAFVTDVFSRKIVGWSTRSTLSTEACPLEALEQAIMDAKEDLGGLTHHADHGSQYTSIAYSEKLAQYGIASSTGSIGDSYDNALAETVNGLYKSELIYSQVWRSCTEVEWATLHWVHWWNHVRLHEALGYATPEEVITHCNQTQARELALV